MKKLFFAIVLGMVFISSVSCGPMVKVTVKGTKDGVNIQTTQSASDSTSLNINVNPTVNIKPAN